jgi:hypothetical protein
MNKTLEQLKYRIENNEYFSADYVRGVIREVDELNQEDQTVAHLLKAAQKSGWLGKVDEAGWYSSLLHKSIAQSERLERVQENRIWLMGTVSAH